MGRLHQGAADAPVWLLTTARPGAWGETVEACRAAGMESRLVVCCDGFRELGEDVWHTEERQGIGFWLQWAFDKWPDAAAYGWLADDTFPRTPGFDRLLAERAGRFGLSYADDGGVVSEEALREGRDLSSGLCWGGELVRAVGWWSLPGLRGAWIDVSWLDIVRPLHLYRYSPEVLVEHRSHRNGGRPADAIDAAGQESIGSTRIHYERFCQSGLAAAVSRVRRAMVAAA